MRVWANVLFKGFAPKAKTLRRRIPKSNRVFFIIEFLFCGSGKKKTIYDVFFFIIALKNYILSAKVRTLFFVKFYCRLDCS